MKCLFTYEKLLAGEKNYSLKGLKQLSPKLLELKTFSYSQKEQLELARRMVKKISIQGIQPKFSVLLSEAKSAFLEAENGGRFIMKPQVNEYPELPENEDLTMHLMRIAGVETPWHGLVRCADESVSYVVKRFDRTAKEKIPLEDFSQLTGAARYQKYDMSTEKAIEVIEDFCTYPSIEAGRLYQRIILAFLLGNEDLHLKNLSLITTKGLTRLSPVYDFVNTTLALPAAEEELALSLNGKKKDFSRNDFVKYLAEEHLFITTKKAEHELNRILALVPQFYLYVDRSFLSQLSKQRYKDIISARAKRLMA